MKKKNSDQIEYAKWQRSVIKEFRKRKNLDLLSIINNDASEIKITKENAYKINDQEKNLTKNSVKLNAFNSCDDHKYKYDNEDVRGILTQILIEFNTKFYQIGPFDEKTFYIDQNVLMKNETMVFLYDIGKLHWVSVVCLNDKEQDILIVLIKDSFGSDEINKLEHILRGHVSFDIDFRYNTNREQFDETSSGIFALQNLKIILKNIMTNKNNFLKNFINFNQFCNQNESLNLRKNDFADKFFINLFLFKW